MKWTTKWMVAAAIGLLVVACAERVASPSLENADRAALTQRIVDLKTSVIATGRPTTVQQQELEQLRQDVLAYQARTGRKDITVTISRPAAAQPGVSLAVKPTDPAPSSCGCPGIKFVDGHICFLYYSSCKPGEGRICTHVCFGTTK